MDVGITIALISATVAVISGFLQFRSSRQANNTESRKVDQVAFDNAISFYQRQNEDANKQIDRLTLQMERFVAQIDKMSTQIGVEQDVSNQLRNQVRTLQSQVDILKTTLDDLRRSLERTRTNASIAATTPPRGS